MAWVRVPSAGAPADPTTAVPLELLKKQLRVDADVVDEDDLHLVHLGAAVTHGQNRCGRPLLPGVYDVLLQGFPEGGKSVEVPVPPGAEIVVDSVTYLDSAGAWHAMAPGGYLVLDDVDPAIVFPVAARWPATRGVPGSARIRFTAEYSNGRVVPQGITTALLMLAAHFASNREAVVTGTIVSEVAMGFDTLVSEYRILRFG